MSLETIDVYDAARYEIGIPHQDFQLLRAQAPVFRHADPQVPEGFWAVTRHPDVVRVSRSSELFSSSRRTAILGEMSEEARAQQQLMMLNMDPPAHTRLRSLVNRGFTPRVIAQMREHLRLASEVIVDKALAAGTGDFVELVAADLPLIVIAELMGVPLEDRHRLFEWSNRLASATDLQLEEGGDAATAVFEIYEYANNLGATKRANPADDIVTKLTSPDENGEALSELEFDLFFLLLMFAGNETTRNAITGGMIAMINNPGQWERLRADPDLAPTAADEIVRWVSPVNAFRRTATQDLELGGQLIRENDKVVIFYSSANFDEDVFTDPYTFDIGRSPNPHIGFGGGGAHFCLGRHLAILEIEQMYRVLVERVRRVELLEPPTRLRSNFVNGVTAMPVRFVPA
ncbi:cholest-4-en-3-one 26-monooxygenase [Parafrankia irregularis]|uniref:Cholest-4-en-3-one 26-monooxygenase n=1 Tax=Parafrankia irregularis TaxID=795642 RepID=A0A0S4QI94_9ACTN|nr:MULTISPECIES: cytochrome P450 [Parafrankia]MBE3200765.1 cytochrome P450 [Parafrankia sp. CH37]CUU54847.1 cholest-4-en-3-one 26-monooxygenase [Parafrankia irregularis]